MVNSAESLGVIFCFIWNTNTSWYLTLDVIYMRFIRKVAVHHYSQKFGMVRHTEFFIVYNEVIVDMNIFPSFPEYNEMGLLQIQRQIINV